MGKKDDFGFSLPKHTSSTSDNMWALPECMTDSIQTTPKLILSVKYVKYVSLKLRVKYVFLFKTTYHIDYGTYVKQDSS